MATERVDFYIVDSEAARACEAIACQLAEKAWAGGLRLYIRAADMEQASRLDQALWTFRQDSFLPHGLITPDAVPPPDDPILIGAPETPAPPNRDMLLNLAPAMAGETAAFRRIAELACRDPALLQAARERFRWYREQGLSPSKHELAPPRGH